MVLSRPVVIWVALSAASACSAEKVCARNVGTVHVTAEPSAVVRRNSRRVLRESSGFIQNQIGWLLDWLVERCPRRAAATTRISSGALGTARPTSHLLFGAFAFM